MREYAGGRPSQSSAARRPSPCTPTLLGTEGVLRCCVCCVVDFCLYAAVLRMERCADLVSVFFGTYGGTLCRSAIWFWDSSVLIVVRCADLFPVFFDIYGDTLYQSSSCILRYLWWYAVTIPFLYSSILIGIFCTSLTFQDRTPSPLPSHAPFFSCRLEASARGRWHRAGLLRRRGDYYLGCGRRRYCGRVCCLSRRRVLALPQCF